MKRGDDLMPVQITVTPIADGEFGRVFLVVFRHDTQPTLMQPGNKTERTLVRHLEEELKGLEEYKTHHPEDSHDPSPLEVYCDLNPEAPECRVYDD